MIRPEDELLQEVQNPEEVEEVEQEQEVEEGNPLTLERENAANFPCSEYPFYEEPVDQDYLAQQNLNTSLKNAIIFNEADSAKKAIDAGADVNGEIAGNSYLFHAVNNDSLEIVNALVQQGALLSTCGVTYNGHTPLHRAIEQDQKNIARLLVCYGADLLAKNKNQDTPVTQARRENQPYEDWESILCRKVLRDFDLTIL